MPTRYLKESICTSENIDMLSPFAETIFYRLVVTCDDFGRFDARSKVLSARLFPLKNVANEVIESALGELVKADLITVYIVNGKPYLQMNSWGRHQTTRAKNSKYPSPDDSNCEHLSTSAYNCQQVQENENDSIQVSEDADKCFRNRTSESESNIGIGIVSFGLSDEESSSDPTALPTDDPKPVKESKKDDTPVVFQLMLNDKTFFDVHQSLIDEYAELYPAVDVPQAFRSMIGWIDSNPNKRKTRTGIKKFINAWLAREQNSGYKRVVNGATDIPKRGANGIELLPTPTTDLDDIF